MAPVLKVLEFLRIIRTARELARECIRRFPGRGVSLLAFLGRKLNTWCRFWLGIFGRPKPAERRLIGSEASSYLVPGGSATAGEYVVAASYVPASASHSSLHEHTEIQRAQTVGVHPPVLASTAVNHPHTTNLPHAFGGGNAVNRSSGNLSAVTIQSRASDKYSIIINSYESIRAPLGQPSRRRRATYPQLGCGLDQGLDQLRSRERATWPPVPTTRPRTHHSPSLEIITAVPSTHGDGKVGPVVEPLASSSCTPEPPSPPPVNEPRRRPPSTSIVLDVKNPSTKSLPISSSTNRAQITDEPFAVDHSTGRSSPDSPAVDLHDEPLQGSPTSSIHPALDLDCPVGRFVQLINYDQIPRYTKNATMQVDYTTLSLHPYILADPAWRHLIM